MLAAALSAKKEHKKKSGFGAEGNRGYLLSSHSISPVSQDSRSESPNIDYGHQMGRNDNQANNYYRNTTNFYQADDLVNRSTEQLNPKETPKNVPTGRKLPPIGQPRKEQPKLPVVAAKSDQANAEDMKQKILNSYLSKYKPENEDAINMNVFKIGNNHVNHVRPTNQQANQQHQAPSGGKRLPQINQNRQQGNGIRPQIPTRGNNVNYASQPSNKQDSVIMFSSQRGTETRTLTENNSDSDESDNWI
jgi:hypothetical protein